MKLIGQSSLNDENALNNEATIQITQISDISQMSVVEFTP